jgi:hypothetical protein
MDGLLVLRRADGTLGEFAASPLIRELNALKNGRRATFCGFNFGVDC